MKQIYLDSAATTPVSQDIFNFMKPYFLKSYGNPSEPHLLGQKARLAIETSRQQVADFLLAKPEEVIFTSCATESINLSHKGLTEAVLLKNNHSFVPHIITSSIEHKAVLETCRHLERLGQALVTYLPVDQEGLISPELVLKAVTPQTILVSLMYVNNEVGTIQPLKEIGLLIKDLNKLRVTTHLPHIYFHTDATQAVQYLKCQVDFLGVDLLSFTGHKIFAPKGVGALYLRKGTPLSRQLDGGGQEMNLRAGTENVPLIAALGQAVQMIKQSSQDRAELIKLRDYLIEQVLTIPGVKLTGHAQKRAPHIASFTIEGAEGEALVLLLSNQGIVCSSGSACTSRSLQPSHVLTAMGIPPEVSHGSIRFSLSRDNTKEDIDYTVTALKKAIINLREMSPLLNYGQSI